MAKVLLRKLVGVLSICLLAVSSLTAFVPVQKVSADFPGGDCDTNAVIRCGVNSIGELKDDYRANKEGGIPQIFSHFSMKNQSAFDGMVRGRVTKGGEIWVGSKKVATGAVTAGRHKMGNDEVKVPGANAWMRPPSRSFRSNSLETLIKLNSRGEFMYGVIMSCGNPVQAQNKFKFPPKEQPKPKPQPKKPALKIKKDVRVVLGDSEWRQQVTADPDDELQYMITVENTGETDLQNVRLQDSLPDGVSFEDGELDIAPTPSNLNFNLSELVGEGINLGTIPKGELRQVTFTVTVGSDTDACEEPMRNVAFAEADDVPEEEDGALARVCQPEEEEEQPRPQVKSEQAPPPPAELPAAGAVGIFSVTSFLGFATYKIKEFYSIFLH